MKNTVVFKSILLCLSVVFSFGVKAFECEEKSPGFIENGDEYYSIKKMEPLTREQSDILKKMIYRNSGRLEGNKVFTDCNTDINIGKATTKSHLYKVNAKLVYNSDGSFEIDIKQERQSDRYGEEKKFVYFRKNTNYKLNYLTPNSFEVVSKFRRGHGAGKGTTLEEEISTFHIKKRSITINTVTYRNGYFGSFSVTRLDKSR